MVALVLVMTAVAAPIALAAKQAFCYRVAIRGVDCDFTKQLCEQGRATDVNAVSDRCFVSKRL